MGVYVEETLMSQLISRGKGTQLRTTVGVFEERKEGVERQPLYYNDTIQQY